MGVEHEVEREHLNAVVVDLLGKEVIKSSYAINEFNILIQKNIIQYST